MSNGVASLDGALTDDPRARACIARYWRRNVTLMAALLFVWAAVSLGCGVLFVEPLNSIRLGGYPLGFWFAQQGSILVFVVLILVYALRMGRLDREHHAELEALAKELSAERPAPR
jgi:putative solute:sodium symporter small subunit